MSINIEELTSRKTEESFPNIFVLSPNDTLPVVVRSLQKGDTQLVAERNGVRKCIARISLSAYNIDMLLRTSGSVEFVRGPEDSIVISEISDYLLAVV